MNFNGYQEYEIDKPGWTETENGLCYVTQRGCIGNTFLSIRSVRGQDFGIISNNSGQLLEYLRMMDLTPRNPATVIIVLNTVLGFLHFLFKKCGIPIKFLLFLYGKRGTMKTSLALTMTQISNKKTAEYPLTSTGAGLEAGFGIYKNAIMLADDLKPSQNIYEQRALHSNLELLVRCYGDGTGRKRNYDFQSSDVQVRQYEAEGGLIVTGEYVTGVESSLSRCLLLPLNEFDVDTNLLTEIQADERCLARFMLGFLDYVTKSQCQILTMISQNCKEYRNKMLNIKGLSNPRYAEYYAQLLMASDILIKYGLDMQQIDFKHAEMLKQRFEGAIMTVICDNNRKLVEESPLVQLCTAIVSAIESEEYFIADVTAIPGDIKRTILEDSTNYYIPQPLIKSMKDCYDKDNGCSCSTMSTSKALSKLLADGGIISPIREGNDIRYAKKLTGHGNIRYMILNKAKLLENTLS